MFDGCHHINLCLYLSSFVMIEVSELILAKVNSYSHEDIERKRGIFSGFGRNEVSKTSTSSSSSSSSSAYGTAENKEAVGVREVTELEETPQHIDQNIKILVVGNPKCGKSSLIKRYVSKGFEREYISTIGADYQRKDMCVTFDDDSIRNIRLQLWDIAGQDRFQKLTRLYFKNARGVIIVCDVSRERTVDAIKLWKSEIDAWIELTESRKIPIVLFANKADLLLSINDAFAAGAAVEKVSHELGMQCWWTTSALSGAGVSEGFAALVKQIIEV